MCEIFKHPMLYKVEIMVSLDFIILFDNKLSAIHMELKYITIKANAPTCFSDKSSCTYSPVQFLYIKM